MHTCCRSLRAGKHCRHSQGSPSPAHMTPALTLMWSILTRVFMVSPHLSVSINKGCRCIVRLKSAPVAPRWMSLLVARSSSLSAVFMKWIPVDRRDSVVWITHSQSVSLQRDTVLFLPLFLLYWPVPQPTAWCGSPGTPAWGASQDLRCGPLEVDCCSEHRASPESLDVAKVCSRALCQPGRDEDWTSSSCVQRKIFACLPPFPPFFLSSLDPSPAPA